MTVVYPEVARLGTILSVWAHPDDESWVAAGIMMAARANGQRVVCVTATRGEQGVQDPQRWPQAELADIREKEMQACLKILDITEHHWLNYHDGECAQIPMTAAVAKLDALIAAVQPDTILTFGPDGLTGHDDHKAISAWVGQAVQKLPLAERPTIYHHAASLEWYEDLGKEWDAQFNIFFNIDTPRLVPLEQMDLCYELSEELITRKLEALRVQPSQTEGMFTGIPQDELHETAARETFTLAR